MKRAWKGMLESKRSNEPEKKELEQIADELDEIADSVDAPMQPPAPIKKRWADASSDSDSSFDPSEVIRGRCHSPTPTRRNEPTPGSSNSGGVARTSLGSAHGGSWTQQSPGDIEADVSGSDVESTSTGVLSPGKW